MSLKGHFQKSKVSLKGRFPGAWLLKKFFDQNGKVKKHQNQNGKVDFATQQSEDQKKGPKNFFSRRKSKKSSFYGGKVGFSHLTLSAYTPASAYFGTFLYQNDFFSTLS